MHINLMCIEEAGFKMKGLIYKDIQLIKEYLYLGIAIFLISVTAVIAILTAQPLKQFLSDGSISEWLAISTFVIILPMIIVSMSSLEMFTKDESYIKDKFYASLPNGATGYIESKYYTILMLYFLLLFAGFISDCIMIMCGAPTESSAVMVMAYLIAVQIILTSIEIPFVVAFGSQIGEIAKFISIMVIAALILIYLLYGDLSIFNEENPTEVIMNYMTSQSILKFHAIVFTLPMILYPLSCKISILMFNRRLCHD